MGRFTPNPDGIEEVGRRVAAALQKVINEVAQEMAGQPADRVEAEIVRRAKAAGLNYRPGADLRQVAEAIERGSFERDQHS